MLCFFFIDIAFAYNIELSVFGSFSKERIIEQREYLREVYESRVEWCISGGLFDKEQCEVMYNPDYLLHESELNSFLSTIKGNIEILSIVACDCELTIDLNNIKGKIGMFSYYDKGPSTILPTSILLNEQNGLDIYKYKFDGSLSSALKLMGNNMISPQVSIQKPYTSKIVEFVGDIKGKTSFFCVKGCNFRIINSPLNVETFIVFYSNFDECSKNQFKILYSRYLCKQL